LSDKYKIGHTFVKELPLAGIKPAQSEVSQTKSNSMADAIKSNRLPPGYIYVSKDNYVIDGHHRFFANKIVNNESIPVIQIDAPIMDILAVLSVETASKGTQDIHGRDWVAPPGRIMGGNRHKRTRRVNTRIMISRISKKNRNKKVNRYNI
jgi:hypothetical protein